MNTEYAHRILQLGLHGLFREIHEEQAESIRAAESITEGFDLPSVIGYSNWEWKIFNESRTDVLSCTLVGLNER